MAARLFCIPLLALTCALSVPSATAETVWSGLVIASNVDTPAPIPGELTQIEGTLKQLFGYNQFEVIGQARRELKTGAEDWTVSSKYFSLKVDSEVGEKAAGYLLNLHLLQEEKLLLETKARLSKRSPLVIRGPQVGAGQLILLMMIE